MRPLRGECPPAQRGDRPAKRARRGLRLDRVDDYRWLTGLAGLLVGGVAVLAMTGVPTVDPHGPLRYLGIMDPLCGATRAMYLSVHGRLRDALTYNPAAPILLATAGAILLRAAAGVLTHRWLTVVLPRYLSVAMLVAALAVLEVNQQSHAALLTSAWTGR